MIKRRLTYDEWECIISKKLECRNICNSDFNGYIALLYLEQVTERQIWKYNGQDIVVCDNGYKWLAIMPENDFYCITVMMDSENTVMVSYIDIIDSHGIDNDGIPYFMDIYLDLVVYPDGTVIIDDMHELIEAMKTNDISQNQYDNAIDTAKRLQGGLLANKEIFSNFIENRLNDIASR